MHQMLITDMLITDMLITAEPPPPPGPRSTATAPGAPQPCPAPPCTPCGFPHVEANDPARLPGPVDIIISPRGYCQEDE